MGSSSKRARNAKESDSYSEDLSDFENDQMTVSKFLIFFFGGFHLCYNVICVISWLTICKLGWFWGRRGRIWWCRIRRWRWRRGEFRWWRTRGEGEWRWWWRWWDGRARERIHGSSSSRTVNFLFVSCIVFILIGEENHLSSAICCRNDVGISTSFVFDSGIYWKILSDIRMKIFLKVKQ